MRPSNEALIPWRERAFLTYAETALIFGRSTSWVHDRLTDGSLTRARVRAGGAIGITVASVVALVDGALPVGEPPAAPPASRPRGKLRLVVSNP